MANDKRNKPGHFLARGYFPEVVHTSVQRDSGA
jgi:hypothetical protein